MRSKGTQTQTHTHTHTHTHEIEKYIHTHTHTHTHKHTLYLMHFLLARTHRLCCAGPTKDCPVTLRVRASFKFRDRFIVGFRFAVRAKV